VKTIRFLLAALASCCLWSGCLSSGGTGTGNPGITIASKGYNVALARRSPFDFVIPSALASSPTLTSMKVCVSEVRFIAVNGSIISIPSTNLGPVDLGDGTKSITWGSVKIPAGTVIDRVYVEMETDDPACLGVGYTVQANGMNVTTELEFHFAFANPVTVGGNATFTFIPTNLSSEIAQAVQAGQFDNAHILNYVGPTLQDTVIDQ
jgi:hypothetical protein